MHPDRRVIACAIHRKWGLRSADVSGVVLAIAQTGLTDWCVPSVYRFLRSEAFLNLENGSPAPVTATPSAKHRRSRRLWFHRDHPTGTYTVVDSCNATVGHPPHV